MKFAFTAAAMALFPLAALAHDGVAVEDGYARASNPKAGAAFMVLDNHREVACTLSGASTDVAEKAELHTHTEVDGVMKMGPIEGGIEVAPGARHALARGGDHVMLMGLHQPLENGQTVKLTLDFGDCGKVDVDLPVDNERAPAPAMGQGEMDHSKMDHGN